MAKPPPGTTPQEQAARYHVANIRHHIMLCSGPDCVAPAEGERIWGYLKRRIAVLGLNAPPHGVYRTRCHCLRICTSGPIMVIYPEGL